MGRRRAAATDGPCGERAWYITPSVAVSSPSEAAMRIIPILALLSLASVPCAAQGIVVPVRCQGECPPPDGLPHTFALDTVKAWASVERGGQARTSADHVFRNETAGTVDAAFFFPLPADATVYEVTVIDALKPAHDNTALLQYNEWSLPDESRWIMDGLIRDRQVTALRAYAGQVLVHVPVRAIPPGGARYLQIQYTQPLRAEGGAITYRYPLSTGAAAAPVGHLTLGMEVETEAGFVELRSPSHVVDVQWGSESAPCPPRFRCGYRGVASERKRVVRLQPADDVRERDFVVVYTPVASRGEPERRRTARVP